MKNISGIESKFVAVLSQPYRLHDVCSSCYPGRCPGLSLSQPFRLKESRGCRYEIPSSACLVRTVPALSQPYRLHGVCSSRYPGRCPGLSLSQPFRLKESRGCRYEIPSSACLVRTVPALSQPYRLHGVCSSRYPGRCPGLSLSQPFRLKESRGCRYEIPSSACLVRTVPALSQPYRLHGVCSSRYPGRCPGLSLSQPFRLKESQGCRYEIPSSACRAGTVLAQGNALGTRAKKHLQPVGLRQEFEGTT